MGKVMRHTLGASLNIRHNLSSSKGPKPLQLKLLTTYIPKTSAFTLAFSTSQRLRTTRASARTFFTFRSEERFSRNAETDLVCRLLLEKKKKTELGTFRLSYPYPYPGHPVVRPAGHVVHPVAAAPEIEFARDACHHHQPRRRHSAIEADSVRRGGSLYVFRPRDCFGCPASYSDFGD